MTEPNHHESGTAGNGHGESSHHVVVVGPDGTPVDAAKLPEPDEDHGESLGDLVEEPAKVMRIGTMIKQLLEEVRAAPLDDASRNRVREIHQTSIRELDDVPSEAELRIAQAQLVGWLEGLFSGIQTALFAQQMAARVQLEQMRRGLPAGPSGAGEGHGHGISGTGQYL